VSKSGSWLKQREPPKGPPLAGHVDVGMLLGKIHEAETAGQNTLAQMYLQEHAPKQELDKWGEPLPLSSFTQDGLDRLVAVLASPDTRGRALLHSGQLAPDERDAIAAVYPEVYDQFASEVYMDMVTEDPPFPAWVEAVIGILYGIPAAQVFTGGSPPRAKDLQAPAKKATAGLDASPPTQADRREIPVREVRT
jgi:hypothetical protein